jgi:hypothetical protein
LTLSFVAGEHPGLLMGALRIAAAVVVVVFGLGLAHPADSVAGKAALKCQQTIAKADAKFLAQRLKRLRVCTNAVLACIQSHASDACIEKATAKCRKQLGTPGDIDAPAGAVEAAVVKACAGIPVGELLAPANLGFANAAAACGAVGVAPLAGAADLARCLQRLHASLAETSFGVEAPRAAELTAQGGVSALVVPDLPVFGGCGACSTPPAATGKSVAACVGTIAKAGGAFLAKARGGLDKCANAFIGCAQSKPGDAGCLAKAKATCAKLPAALAAGRSKLQAALAKKCGGALPFATLAAPPGANLGAVVCECDNVGVTPLATLDDYGVCLARQHECALASVLPSVAPSLDGLLAGQGLAVTDLLCPPPTAGLARLGPRPIAIFGNISKFLSGIFPATKKTSFSPFATHGAPPRVGRPLALFGGCHPAPGRTCGFRFPITKRPFTLKSATRGARAAPPTLIIAVQRGDGEVAQDHFELTLGDTSVDSQVDLNVTYANDLASCHFDLALAVVEDGEVSEYTKVEQEPHPIPPNDECFTDRGIEGDTFDDVLDVTEATASDGEPFPSCGAVTSVANTVWYEFTAPANGTVTADTFGSDYDTLIAVWTGACNDLTQILPCNDDAGGTPQSKVAIPVQQGTTYFFEVGAKGDPLDTGILHFGFRFVPAGTPPTISKPTIALDELNTCVLPQGPASFFRVDVDFVDPDGDVLQGTTGAQVHFEFRPLNGGGDFPIFPADVAVSGDGFSGHAAFFVCYRFADQTSVDTTIQLVDPAGAGNAVTVKTNRPAGAE